MQKKVFYWSPHINEQVATVKAVLNSAHSLSRYSKDFRPYIINTFGEWNNFSSKLDSFKISTVKIFNLNIKLPINGFLKSRIFYIFFSIIIFFPLINLIKKYKPDYIIIHLITIPVLLASFFFKDTKFILRISGFPKLNFFRRFLWRLLSKRIIKIFTPTILTKKLLIKKKIFDENKIHLLEDPIIEIRKIVKFKNEQIKDLSNDIKYIISIGRLTKQKNFEFLIKSFSKIKHELKDTKLLIIGSGEDREKLTRLINKYNLEKIILLKEYKENIFNYLQKAQFFLLTSNVEDPGFVIIEAAACNKFIICSNVNSGPKEFIDNQKNGLLFEKNNYSDFRKMILKFYQYNEYDLKKIKLSFKIKSKNYTIFRHFCKLNSFLRD